MQARIQGQIDQRLAQLVEDVSNLGDLVGQKLHLSPPNPISIPEGEVVDVYGMPLDKKHYEEYYRAKVKFERCMEKQRKLLGPLSSTLSDPTPDALVFAPVVKNGIPEEFRPRLWPLFASRHSTVKPTRGKYQELLRGDLSKVAVAVQQIGKDVHRTFPNYGGEEFRSHLKHVLLAYAAYNPTLGYCQAMNFLAGGLLVFCSEETSFWMVAYIVDEMLTEYYTENMIGSIADCAVLEQLLSQRFPALIAHLNACGLPLQLIVTQWLMCLFLNTLPPITAFHIWDLIFYSGPKVIFEVCIALFKLTQKALMHLEDPVEIVYYLNGYAQQIFDVTKILDEMQPLDVAEIQDMRSKHRTRINGESKKKDNNKLIKYVESHTTFGTRELEALLQYFNKLGASEKGINLDSFLNALHEVLPQLVDAPDQHLYFDENVTAAQKLFSLFDVNGDNLVNFRELVSGISVMCKGTLDDRLRLCFTAFSTDGYMYRRDLNCLLATLYSMYYEKGFQKEVSFFVDMIFMEVDRNADGYLSFDEFQAAAEMQPFLMKCFRVDSVIADFVDISSPKKSIPTQQLLTDPEEWVVM